MEGGKRILRYSALILLLAAMLPLSLRHSASAENVKTNILVYMIGSDLETEDAAATKDINEMLTAAKKLGNEIELTVYAGGARQWHNEIFSSEENRCVKIGRKGAELLYADGKRDMTDPLTLANFITYCRKSHPADRSILIIWDHGFGIYGIGADEQYEYSKPLTPVDLFSALKWGGTEFDIIGFDACSMASFEMAYSICDFARYMVASEEMEPKDGWDYEAWLTMLAKRSDLSSDEICRKIVNTYIDCCAAKAPGIKDTMSVIDLKKIDEKVPPAMRAFTRRMNEDILNGSFDIVGMQRALNSHIMRANHVYMIDAIEFLGKLKTEEAFKLKMALRECVIYNKKYPANIEMNGILIYMPLNRSVINGVRLDNAESMKGIGISDLYVDWVMSFRKYLQYTETKDARSRTLMDVVTGTVKDDYETALESAISETQLDLTGCYITEDENHSFQVVMPEEQKKLISYICQAMYLDVNGEIIDYGMYCFKPEDFPIEDSGFWKTMREKWVFINGIMCPFYMEEKTVLASGRTAVYGYTKICRNGEEGALFMRIVYDGDDDSVTVEPLCFQKVDFTQSKPQFGRTQPVSDFDSEDVIYICCSLYTEEKGNSLMVRLTDDMKWGDVTSFELRYADVADSFSYVYAAMDLYTKLHDFEVRIEN